MALKFMVGSLDEVTEDVRNVYVQGDDGKFYVDVDGVVSKDKLNEFRENNIKLLKDLERFKDIDPEEYRSIKNEIETLRKTTKKLSPEELDQLVNEKITERVAKMKDEHKAELVKKDEMISVQSRQLESLLIDSAIRSEATKNGVRAAAVDDVLLRAKTIFQVKDGAAVPVGKDGQVIYGKDATNPMSASEWIGSLKKDAPHLFEDSRGSGAGGSSGSAGNNTNMSSIAKIAAGLQQ